MMVAGFVFENSPMTTQSLTTMKILRLFSLLLCFAVTPVFAADKPPVPKNVKNVGVEEFDRLRAEKNSVVLDVRTEKEFKDGHIPGAVNLDVNAPDFAKKLAALDKDKTYLVHCAAGRRSLKACGVMDQSEFKKLVNLEEGFSAWSKAGKPVEKK